MEVLPTSSTISFTRHIVLTIFVTAILTVSLMLFLLKPGYPLPPAGNIYPQLAMAWRHLTLFHAWLNALSVQAIPFACMCRDRVIVAIVFNMSLDLLTSTHRIIIWLTRLHCRQVGDQTRTSKQSSHFHRLSAKLGKELVEDLNPRLALQPAKLLYLTFLLPHLALLHLIILP